MEITQPRPRAAHDITLPSRSGRAPRINPCFIASVCGPRSAWREIGHHSDLASGMQVRPGKRHASESDEENEP